MAGDAPARCIYLDALAGPTGIILGNDAAIYAQVNRSRRSLTNKCDDLPGFLPAGSGGVFTCNAYIPDTADGKAQTQIIAG